MFLRYTKISLATMALVLLSGVTSACGGGGGSANEPETETIDVGGDQTVDVPVGEPLKVAFFSEGANNSAMQASIKGAEDRAAKLGWEIDVFDGKFDPTTQANQLQSALTRDYDAWVIKAVEGNQVCDIVTKQAPQQDILVSVSVLPICGRAGNEGEDLWAPGTLNYVGGNESPAAFKIVLERAVEENAGPQKVGVVTGPELNPITMNLEKALDEVTAEHPEFDIVAKARTDYSTPVAQEKAVPMIRANPDLDIIFTAFSNLSKGAVPALEAAGRADEVKVYEAGGTEWAVDALKKGDIEVTTALRLGSSAANAVQSLADAQAGKSVPRVMLNDGEPLMSGQKEGQVHLVDRDNVDAYEPEVE